MWWKKNKWNVIVPVLIVAVLAAAFWYGGGAPGLMSSRRNIYGTATLCPADHSRWRMGHP